MIETIYRPIYIEPCYTRTDDRSMRYSRLRELYLDDILLVRIGDFYECFGQDAIDVGKLAGVTVYKHLRNDKMTDHAGFPYQSTWLYIEKIIAGGRTVVLTDMEKEL